MIELHLAMEQYAADEHAGVEAWLKARPRVHVHHPPRTPPGGTWSRSGRLSPSGRSYTAAPTRSTRGLARKIRTRGASVVGLDERAGGDDQAAVGAGSARAL